MFSITGQSGRTNAYVTEFVADTVADITNLPTDVAVGSSCFVIDGGKLYMLNHSLEWKEV